MVGRGRGLHERRDSTGMSSTLVPVNPPNTAPTIGEWDTLRMTATRSVTLLTNDDPPRSGPGDTGRLDRAIISQQSKHQLVQRSRHGAAALVSECGNRLGTADN